MITPIIKQTKKEKKQDIAISQARIEELLKRVYNLMLAYGNFENRIITKFSPIMVGNVKFWFEHDDIKNEYNLRFSPSVHGWNEGAMEVDLEQHFHNIFFSATHKY
jgi:hypothetical protein